MQRDLLHCMTFTPHTLHTGRRRCRNNQTNVGTRAGLLLLAGNVNESVTGQDPNGGNKQGNPFMDLSLTATQTNIKFPPVYPSRVRLGVTKSKNRPPPKKYQFETVL